MSPAVFFQVAKIISQLHLQFRIRGSFTFSFIQHSLFRCHLAFLGVYSFGRPPFGPSVGSSVGPSVSLSHLCKNPYKLFLSFPYVLLPKRTAPPSLCYQRHSLPPPRALRVMVDTLRSAVSVEWNTDKAGLKKKDKMYCPLISLLLPIV